MLLRLDDRARSLLAAEGIRFPGLFVISGFRSSSLQDQLNPSAPRSFHTRCPALAADLRVGDVPASVTPFEVWAFLGGIWKLMGGRWGGDFNPPDPNHFDLPSF